MADKNPSDNVLNKLSNNVNALNKTIKNQNNFSNQNNMIDTSNIEEPIETFSALSFCTKVLWAIPVIVSIIQLIIWANNLYRSYVLKIPSPAEIARKKEKELHSKIDELKALLSKQ